MTSSNGVTSAPTGLRRVFICYRSDDTGGVADRLASELSRALDCEVFLDHRSLEGGAVWTKQLLDEVGRADVVLVLIGTRWLTLQDSDGIRRLDDPNDWVRQEIERAITKNRTIVPLLIDGASPVVRRALRNIPSIESFADRQPMPLVTRRWDADFGSLVATLTQLGFRKRAAGDIGASPAAGSRPAGNTPRVDDLPSYPRTQFPIRALVAGSTTTAIIAIANRLTGISIPSLEVWDVSSTATVRVLITMIAGSGTFYVLKGQRRARSLWCAVLAGAGCGYAWYVYAVKAAAPANAGDWLTWNGTLYILYLTGFALCATAFNAIVRVIAPRA